MRLIAREELLPRICVTLTAKMFERVRCGYAPESRAHGVARAARHTFEKPAPKRVADSRRIDNSVRRHGRHVGRAASLENRAAVLASCDDERAAFSEDGLL